MFCKAPVKLLKKATCVIIVGDQTQKIQGTTNNWSIIFISLGLETLIGSVKRCSEKFRKIQRKHL